MAGKEVTATVFDKEASVREEYEIQFYDFSINEFKEENYDFVNGMIDKAMSESCKHIIGLVEENPELAVKIKETSKIIAKDMKIHCRQGVQKVNDLIEEHFKIPDNVLVGAKPIPEAEEQSLLAECEELEKCLIQNGIFMKGLENELQSFDQLAEARQYEQFLVDKATEQLDVKLRPDLSILTAEKVAKSSIIDSN